MIGFEDNSRARRIIRIYNWIRYILIAVIVILLYLGLRNA